MLETLVALMALLVLPGLGLVAGLGVAAALAASGLGAAAPGRTLTIADLADLGAQLRRAVAAPSAELAPALAALLGAALVSVLALAGLPWPGVTALLALPVVAARLGPTGTAERAAPLLTVLTLALSLGLGAVALAGPAQPAVAGVGGLVALLAAGTASAVFGRVFPAEVEVGPPGALLPRAADYAWLYAWGLGLAAAVPGLSGPLPLFGVGVLVAVLALGVRAGIERLGLVARLGWLAWPILLLALVALALAVRPG